jgi:DNA helicase HerA-like ATPase
LLQLDDQGGEHFFGEPMLDVDDLIQTVDGRGVVNVLAADRLLQSPGVYSTMLLWLLSELFEQLPEVGDPDKPNLVFFFDEAHLLFDGAPKALVEKIELVVRLIRSKGVGVFFVTQNALDVPDEVLGQLGNRIQHALRAFTPRDQKAVKAAAETLRQNPALDAEKAIAELGVGEALVSCLDASGAPGVVQRAWVNPPASRIGPATPEERRAVMNASAVQGHYEAEVDRESAYEELRERAAARQAGGDPAPDAGGSRSMTAGRKLPESPTVSDNALSDLLFGTTGPRGGKREGLLEAATKSAARSLGSGLGRNILRGVLGSMFSRRR